jgi:hypothetical protein
MAVYGNGLELYLNAAEIRLMNDDVHYPARIFCGRTVFWQYQEASKCKQGMGGMSMMIVPPPPSGSDMHIPGQLYNEPQLWSACVSNQRLKWQGFGRNERAHMHEAVALK